MFSTRQVAELAFIAQRATESEQSSFDPDTSLVPDAECRATLLCPKPLLLDVMDGALSKRESSRSFDGQSPDEGTALSILNAAYGPMASGRRTVPSAGSYYPLVLHLCRLDRGMIRSVQCYDGMRGALHKKHNVSLALQDALFVYHADLASASWFILWSCRLLPIASKYGAKAYRFVCIEVGHSAQMAILESLAHGLKSLPVGGLDERWLRQHVTREGRRLLPQYGLLL